MELRTLQNQTVHAIGQLRFTYVDSHGFAQREWRPIIELCDDLALAIRESTSTKEVKIVIQSSLLNPDNQQGGELHSEQIVEELLIEETKKLYNRLTKILDQ